MSGPSKIPAIRHAVSVLYGLASDGETEFRYADDLQAAAEAVDELIAENERLKRALRQPTAETFAQDVAEYESTLEGA